MSQPRIIRPGDNVLLSLPNNDVKLIKIPDGNGKGDVKLGKYGIFRSEHLLGHPFGLSYELEDKKALKVVPPKTIGEIEETDATNELINDDGKFAQPLTTEEIEALKASGAHVTEIIKRQIEAHTNYELKNEYSKEKYKKRKEAKFSKGFTVVEPTLFNICEYHFSRDPSKIRDLRPHTLGQLLNSANIRPGARVLVADDVSGLLVAAVLERLGGQGRCIAVTDVDGPSAFPIVPHMNFESGIRSSTILSTINWAAADEEYTPLAATRTAEEPPEEPQTNKEKAKQRKRRATANFLSNLREELFTGEFDSLIVASQFEPFSVVEKLSQYIAGSGQIAVYSPYIQPLIEAQSRMRPMPKYLAPSVSETWHREYQVLPGRTHPHMNMPGAGGYILTTIKVYDDPEASSVLVHRKELRAKRRRLAEEKATAAQVSEAPADNVEEEMVGASEDTTPAPASVPEVTPEL
ncbi:TRNA (adenine(58)-N(1))-methyltransferase non-catalytic subunit TRM6 [Ceratobasidium theobromae]|uniref:tRNA (adenine(58)-N(1))-methyltransferase non-catalytic subunit TRM6 n=1 Tax=Ceratobasidium theobromae TaxID=1582974 RepID=A0A5N5QK75_9AGAM|nr:TRNA (adenine(58)-N(1))-methyltransferase non-catalytic subunit TRM6 [Ceratobasidium theobromae]